MQKKKLQKKTPCKKNLCENYAKKICKKNYFKKKNS